MTNSIGSTSFGINTKLGFLFSIKLTTWFNPYLTAYGFLLTSSFFFPSFTAVASFSNRSFFSAFVSGLYLLRSLKVWVAVLRSRTLLNCAMAGGTLRRRERIFFWRWRRTYSGHFTMRERLRRGWMSWPMPKLRGRFSMRGFWVGLLMLRYRLPHDIVGRKVSMEHIGTYLCSLLGSSSLALGEGRGRRPLSLFWRLSLRRKIISESDSPSCDLS